MGSTEWDTRVILSECRGVLPAERRSKAAEEPFARTEGRLTSTEGRATETDRRLRQTEGPAAGKNGRASKTEDALRRTKGRLTGTEGQLRVGIDRQSLPVARSALENATWRATGRDGSGDALTKYLEECPAK